MSNFIPNETISVNPRDPEWLNHDVKKMLKNQNKIHKKFKRNGYKNEDKIVLDRLRNQCFDIITYAKEKHLKDLGDKLANPATGQKTYWKIVNKFLNKCKVPRIHPLLIQDKYITNCKDKAVLFNNYFTSQCSPIVNDSELPVMNYRTNETISSFLITSEEITEIIASLNINKAQGPDNISASMIKLCGQHLCVPLTNNF